MRAAAVPAESRTAQQHFPGSESSLALLGAGFGAVTPQQRSPRLCLCEAQALSSEEPELQLSPCPPSSCATGVVCFTNAFLFPSCWKSDSTKTHSS